MAKEICGAKGGCGEGERQAAFQREKEGGQSPARCECACRPEIMRSGHAMPGACMKKPGNFAFTCAVGVKMPSKRMAVGIAALGRKGRPAGSEGFRARSCSCMPRTDPARILKP
ncbi:MAG: hypothetical protein LBU32_23700 [Clostridiales bacterium]|jgi:hypothetical protein|nr:hypothetical protein [Clostridiales bacterium]